MLESITFSLFSKMRHIFLSLLLQFFISKVEPLKILEPRIRVNIRAQLCISKYATMSSSNESKSNTSFWLAVKYIFTPLKNAKSSPPEQGYNNTGPNIRKKKVETSWGSFSVKSVSWTSHSSCVFFVN